METEAIALLRGDIAGLRHDMAVLQQDIGILETKADSLEAWRVRYLVQEDQLINKLFGKIDELVAGLGNVRADLSRTRGERDAERRMSMMVISLLSAACGGLVTSLFHG
jgi:hypothetical protein